MAAIDDKCGLFGIWNDDDAVVKTFYGLFSLQHRGQESAGIASTNGKNILHYKDMGLVSQVFTPPVLDSLKNPRAIGHTRYSTTGSNNIINTQPFVVEYARGKLAIAHNGNIINAHTLRKQHEKDGSIFQTTMDTEVIAHMIARPSVESQEENISRCLNELHGAFSLVMLAPDKLIGIRDPNGFRPLWIGKTDSGYALASETCAFTINKITPLREVNPGEMVIIDNKGVHSITYAPDDKIKPSPCIFELIYLARPDSYVFGESVHEFRKGLGRQLAVEHPVDADVVVGIPDTGNAAAIGFSNESGIPIDLGFIRSHYVGRTFIQPVQAERETSVEVKLSVIREVVKGKRVVVIDDSIVRGTTCKREMRLLKEAAAKEIHVRISCPPIKSPCYFGIDFHTKEELIANNLTIQQIRDFLEVESLGYLSLDGLKRCVTAANPEEFCCACFSGQYPLPLNTKVGKYVLERSS